MVASHIVSLTPKQEVAEERMVTSISPKHLGIGIGEMVGDWVYLWWASRHVWGLV